MIHKICNLIVIQKLHLRKDYMHLSFLYLSTNDVCQDQCYSTKYCYLITNTQYQFCKANLKYWLKIKIFLTVDETKKVQLMQKAISIILIMFTFKSVRIRLLYYQIKKKFSCNICKHGIKLEKTLSNMCHPIASALIG